MQSNCFKYKRTEKTKLHTEGSSFLLDRWGACVLVEHNMGGGRRMLCLILPNVSYHGWNQNWWRIFHCHCYNTWHMIVGERWILKFQTASNNVGISSHGCNKGWRTYLVDWLVSGGCMSNLLNMAFLLMSHFNWTLRALAVLIPCRLLWLHLHHTSFKKTIPG